MAEISFCAHTRTKSVFRARRRPSVFVFRVTIAPRQFAIQFVPTRRPCLARRRHAVSTAVAAIVTATDGKTERAKSAPVSLHAQLLYLQQYTATAVQAQ